MSMSFESEIIFWHGPSPFVFAVIPDGESNVIKSMANEVSYGWGCIPVNISSCGTNWNTSLIPKDGKYLIPIKKLVQNKIKIEIGLRYAFELTINIKDKI